MQKQVEDIEMLLAHHDQQIADLNDVITRQWADMDRMRRELDRVLGRVKMLEANAPDSDRDGLSSIEQAAMDIPPHY